ncbi:MAG: hypothetical protein HY540_03400 [Deltaproteobacteria bacterium]|nr:hypothetical protein [Deltaproteobacteria bacterium]
MNRFNMPISGPFPTSFSSPATLSPLQLTAEQSILARSTLVTAGVLADPMAAVGRPYQLAAQYLRTASPQNFSETLSRREGVHPRYALEAFYNTYVQPKGVAYALQPSSEIAAAYEGARSQDWSEESAKMFMQAVAADISGDALDFIIRMGTQGVGASNWVFFGRFFHGGAVTSEMKDHPLYADLCQMSPAGRALLVRIGLFEPVSSTRQLQTWASQIRQMEVALKNAKPRKTPGTPLNFSLRRMLFGHNMNDVAAMIVEGDDWDAFQVLLNEPIAPTALRHVFSAQIMLAREDLGRAGSAFSDAGDEVNALRARIMADERYIQNAEKDYLALVAVTYLRDAPSYYRVDAKQAFARAMNGENPTENFRRAAVGYRKAGNFTNAVDAWEFYLQTKPKPHYDDAELTLWVAEALWQSEQESDAFQLLRGEAKRLKSRELLNTAWKWIPRLIVVGGEDLRYWAEGRLWELEAELTDSGQEKSQYLEWAGDAMMLDSDTSFREVFEVYVRAAREVYDDREVYGVYDVRVDSVVYDDRLSEQERIRRLLVKAKQARDMRYEGG